MIHANPNQLRLHQLRVYSRGVALSLFGLSILIANGCSGLPRISPAGIEPTLLEAAEPATTDSQRSTTDATSPPSPSDASEAAAQQPRAGAKTTETPAKKQPLLRKSVGSIVRPPFPAFDTKKETKKQASPSSIASQESETSGQPAADRIQLAKPPAVTPVKSLAATNQQSDTPESPAEQKLVAQEHVEIKVAAAKPSSAKEQAASKLAPQKSNTTLEALAQRMASGESQSPQDTEELRRAIESSGDSLPPLLKQQLLGMLEYSRTKTETPKDSDSPSSQPARLSEAVDLTAAPIQSKSPVSDSPMTSLAAERSKTSPRNAPVVTAASVAPLPIETTSPIAGNSSPANQQSPAMPQGRLEPPQLTNVRSEPANAPSRSTTASSLSNSTNSNREPPRLLSAPSVAAEIPSDFASTKSPNESKPLTLSTDERNRRNAWRDAVREAIEAIEDELKKPQADMRAEDRVRMAAQLRLLYAAADRREDAVREIEDLSKSQQEFWKHQVHGLLVALNAEGIPDDQRRSAVVLRHLRSAANHLAAASTLDLRNLAFCTQVDNFGTYAEFSRYEFKPDQELLLYVEIDNFAVEEKSSGRKGREFETELKGNYQILDNAGRRIVDVELPTDRQTCRNHRRDYFIAYRIYLPKKIEPGSYTLQLTIEDVKGSKFGQGSLELKIKSS